MMALVSRFGGVVIAVAVLGAAGGTASMARENQTVEQDRAGIERLHQQDIAATLSDKADELANLWDNDAVRIQPGYPAEVLHRQADGSWKFARVMNFTENLASAAPVSNRCE